MAICSSAAQPVRPQTQWSLRAKPIPWLSWKSPALLTPSILVRASWWTPQVVWTSSWAVTEIVPRSNFPFRTETYKQSILARVWIHRRICTLAFFRSPILYVLITYIDRTGSCYVYVLKDDKCIILVSVRKHLLCRYSVGNYRTSPAASVPPLNIGWT